jgi:hypothetical protein
MKFGILNQIKQFWKWNGFKPNSSAWAKTGLACVAWPCAAHAASGQPTRGMHPRAVRVCSSMRCARTVANMARPMVSTRWLAGENELT